MTGDLDLRAVAARYSKALDAKPSKGPWEDAKVAWITDSVADVPQLLAEIDRLNEELDRARLADTYTPEGVDLVMAKLRDLREQNTRYATRLATYRETMQEQLDPTFQAMVRVQALVSDWQANGNSRELGDHTADVWQACARQLLDALNPPTPVPGRHTITVNGAFLSCTCGLADQAGALSIFNHACHHGGADVTDGHGTVWVDKRCRVEGDSIVSGPGEVDRG